MCESVGVDVDACVGVLVFSIMSFLSPMMPCV